MLLWRGRRIPSAKIRLAWIDKSPIRTEIGIDMSRLNVREGSSIVSSWMVRFGQSIVTSVDRRRLRRAVDIMVTGKLGSKLMRHSG